MKEGRTKRNEGCEGRKEGNGGTATIRMFSETREGATNTDDMGLKEGRKEGWH